MKHIKFSSSENEKSAESEDELNSSRLENLRWCRCSHCIVMPTFIESKCCKEYEGLLGDKLEAAVVSLKTTISTKILNFVIKIQKNITPLFRPKSTKLTAYLLFRIVQRKLYQKMGQIGQEMTELCHFYRNFRNGP